MPDGKAGADVYAVLREAIEKTGRMALARVVISQRERTIAIRPMGRGLVAQTLYEDRDLNPAAPMFEDVGDIKTDPEMVALATQLIDRQTGRYDAADVEDRYETRLKAMLDAKREGLKLNTEDDDAVPTGNVVDLMAALRKSLDAPKQKVAAPAAPTKAATASKKAKKTPTLDELRRQPAFKLPIEGGRKPAKSAQEVVEPAMPERAARSRRKAS